MTFTRSVIVHAWLILWCMICNPSSYTFAFLHQQHHQLQQHTTKSQTILQVTSLPSITVGLGGGNGVLLKPATEHTQPLWGPPDPYLSAGKSIAPSAQALADMGITATTTTSSSTTVPIPTGWGVLDSSTIQAQSLLPGFAPTQGILPTHVTGLPMETSETFAAQVEWSAQFLNVIDQIPTVVFVYALIEFFFLRPNLDLYQQEIQQQPTTQIMAGTIAVTSVRVGVFFLIAILTCTIFG